MKIATGILILVFLFQGESITRASQITRGQELKISNISIDALKLKYAQYSVQKRHREVRIDNSTRGVEDEYVILKRQGRTLARFDGVLGPVGSMVDFGLFSLLGNGRKQLVVSQDIFRGGNQWVVRLGRKPRVIYDGNQWRTGREGDDMTLVDLNDDGIYEILVPTCIFYGFKNLCPGCTPLPTIVFQYSTSSGKYLPANLKFSNYLLRGIDERSQNIRQANTSPDDMYHLGDVLDVVLGYIFAGREREAWTFYDQAYKLPDKDRMKKDIKAKLNNSPVYLFIYRRHTRQRV